MFATVKIIIALVIACGSAMAVFVESTHPGFVTCFCIAFAVGEIAGEVVRFSCRRRVRWLARRTGIPGALRIAGAGNNPSLLS